MMRTFIFLLTIMVLCPMSAGAADPSDIVKNVDFEQRLNQQVPLDLPFVDETGKAVKLGDYFGEKPVILVLAYYRCPRLCTLVLNGLSTAMHEMPLTPGKDFNVVTVSFDPRETAELAAKKKKTYVAAYGRPGAEEGWHFLTGDQGAIDKLTDAVGFRYVYDAKQDQYIHTSGIVVLTPHGKVSRYFLGIRFPAGELQRELSNASAEKIGSLTDEILLYCFHYDPETGKYSANILAIVRVGGVLTVLGLVAMVWFLKRRERRKRLRREAAQETATPAAEPTASAPGGSP
jgi:protein SCO1